MLKETDVKKTKARRLGITEFPYREYDSNNNVTYWEDSDGFWYKLEYDSNGKENYVENSIGEWRKRRKINYKNKRLLSTENTLYYPEYAKATYSHFPDDMIIKYEHHINWLMISFLPTLSKNIIDKYSDRLDLDIVKFFNKNL